MGQSIVFFYQCPVFAMCHHTKQVKVCNNCTYDMHYVLLTPIVHIF